MDQKRKKLLIIIGSLAALIIILSAAGISYTSKPSFCSTCHIMKEPVEAWKASAHSGQNCLNCHADHGLVGKLKVKIRGLGHVVSVMSGTKTIEKKAEVPNSRCTYCHDDLNVTTKNKIYYPHEKHIKDSDSCIACHKNIAHKYGEVKKTSMSTCVDCHKNFQAAGKKSGPIEDCKACHKGSTGSSSGAAMPASHTGNWKITHGQDYLKDKASCESCHKSQSNGQLAKLCVDCHKVEMPHKEGYVAAHVADYNKDKNICLNCHKDTPPQGAKALGCSQCHKVEMPHKEGYLKIHVTEYNKDKNVCSNCHKSPQPAGVKAVSCISCHKVDMPHPANWKNNHASAGKNKNNCLYCHSSKNPINPKASYTASDYCTKCHSTSGGKHPANWKDIHGAEINTKYGGSTDSCVTCHTPSSGFCQKCHAQ